MLFAKDQNETRDAEMLQRIANGDHDAYYELVRPCERCLFLTALAIVGNEANAEDVVQEAILKGFRNIHRFRGDSKFSTWLVQIAINEAKMKIRKDRRHLYDSLEEGARNDEGDYLPRDYADWREIPSEALERTELREALMRALNSLPSKYRTVLILRDVQQLNIRETANALGISVASVKTRLLRARLQMREALAPGLEGAWSSPGSQRSGSVAASAREASVVAATMLSASPVNAARRFRQLTSLRSAFSLA